MTRSVLADWRSAPISGRLRAVFGFLEKLNGHPERVESEDVDALRRAGLTDDEIADAIYVCVAFNVIDRIADAFEFEVPNEEINRRMARFLLGVGYRV